MVISWEGNPQKVIHSLTGSFIHFPVLPCFSSTLVAFPCPTKKISSPLFPAALGATVCHALCPFVQTAVLADVHCGELLVLFWCTISTGPSPKLFSNVLLLSQSWRSMFVVL